MTLSTIAKIGRIELSGNRFINDPKDNEPVLISSLPVAEVDRIYDLMFSDPIVDDTVKCCPECEIPNQFGEICPACKEYLEDDLDGYYNHYE